MPLSPTSSSQTVAGLASGLYAALATPRRPQCMEADTGRLLDYLGNIERAGVDGMVLFGSTGEFVHFDTDQRRAVCSLALKRTRVPVLVNISHSTLEGALHLAESASSFGAAGLLLMPPYFYRYNDAEIFAFYSEFFAEFAPRVPIYLYNLPFFTNPLTAAGLRRLLIDLPFAGIKDSSGEWDLFTSLLATRQERPFQLLAGHERIFTKARQAGAVGAVSGVAAGIPELMVRLERSIRESDEPRIARLDARVQQLLAWLDRFPSPVGIRHLVLFRGWSRASTPDPVEPALLALYRDWLTDWLPATLNDCHS